jgi:hypothetical protein
MVANMVQLLPKTITKNKVFDGNVFVWPSFPSLFWEGFCDATMRIRLGVNPINKFCHKETKFVINTLLSGYLKKANTVVLLGSKLR